MKSSGYANINWSKETERRNFAGKILEGLKGTFGCAQKRFMRVLECSESFFVKLVRIKGDEGKTDEKQKDNGTHPARTEKIRRH